MHVSFWRKTFYDLEDISKCAEIKDGWENPMGKNEEYFNARYNKTRYRSDAFTKKVRQAARDFEKDTQEKLAIEYCAKCCEKWPDLKIKKVNGVGICEKCRDPKKFAFRYRAQSYP